MENNSRDNFYIKTSQDTIKNFNTHDEMGLDEYEASARLVQYGRNELEEKKKPGLLSKLIGQFADFLVIILIAAAVISFLLGEQKDAIVIISIVIINAALGIYQEGKAEKSLESLQKMTSANSKVIREGRVKIIPASEIVPGDIVSLETGDIIPADLRLVQSSNLKVEESSLTGESVPVEKDASIVFDEDKPLGDRINMAYMSTIVTYGRGTGVVVGTGHNTEIGEIATMIQSYEDEATPLQKQLNNLGKSLGIITILICIAVFFIGYKLQGRNPMDMFMIAISLAVAAIPEGLPAIVTIVLAIGMNRMVEKNAIVKKLLAVETLGATTVICSDKTGTLTQNEMTATKLYVDGKIVEVSGSGYEPIGRFSIEDEEIDPHLIGDLETLLAAATLSNDAVLESGPDGFNIIGDPTEGSLVTLGEKAKFNKKEFNDKYKRVGEIPFDSTRKMMTTFHQDYIPGGIISFTKGAPDIIIDRCTKISTGGAVREFSDELKAEVLKANREFSSSALRVLAFAYRDYDSLPENIDSETDETDMVFIGLVGLIDPARPEARDAISRCTNAGIKTVMITGDYKETAFAIAKDLGIADNIDQTMIGEELDNYTPEELQDLVGHIRVYARVSPQHKVKIIEALKANGEVTSMTGDGVNDALALKRADIGVAMGITGTDVAKNTAEMILTDDNFVSIVDAVEEGRIIYSNIKKFVFFLLSCNIGEVFLVLGSILLGLPIPLIPIQLLWLNLVTDSFPALALGVEKGDPDIMDQKPRDPKSSILSGGMIFRILIQGLAIGGTSLAAFYFGLQYYPDNLSNARTLVFATLIVAELLRAYSSRSENYSIFEIGIFSNPQLVLATSFSFALLLAVIYIPLLQPLFDTFPLGLDDWKIILPLGFIPLIIGELFKLFKKTN